jgi:hypothetical protein
MNRACLANTARLSYFALVLRLERASGIGEHTVMHGQFGVTVDPRVVRIRPVHDGLQVVRLTLTNWPTRNSSASGCQGRCEADSAHRGRGLPRMTWRRQNFVAR